MAFDDVRVSEDIEWGAVGGPVFQTDVVVFDSGQEQRNQNWANSRSQWDIQYGIKTQTEMDSLVSFFRERRGKARGFRFKDWVDYELTTENIGTGDTVETEFQVTKTYGSTNPEVRTIHKIVAGSYSVFVNAVLQTEGGGNDYTIDIDTGIITFNSAPAAVPITITAEFDVPVRFDVDSMRVSIDDVNLTSWGGVRIVEIDPTSV